MSDDLLEPDVLPPGDRTLEDEDRRDDVADPVAQEASSMPTTRRASRATSTSA